MNKKILTMIFIFIIAIILFANFSIVQASGLSDAITAGEDFTKNGKSSIINYQNLYNVVNYLYNIAMLIAIIIAIIIGIVLGIRIVFGSIDERADSKHLMVPYLATVAMIACAFTIWKIILQIIHNHI